MVKQISILFFLSSIYLLGFSQTETLLTEGIEKKIEIKYDFNKSVANNKIIEIVAKAKALPEHAITLQYDVKEHRQVIKNTNKLKLQLSVGNFVFADEVKYQKFDIGSYLNPSLISYTYIFADQNNNVLETKTVKDAKFVNGSYLLKKSIPDPAISETYQLYLSEFELNFSSTDFEKLNDFITAVDGYYNADARLNMLEQEMDNITTDSIEMLEAYRQITIDNVKTLNKIRSQRYASKLRLDSYDPIQFKSHFGKIEVQNRNLKKELQRVLDNMHVTYYKKGKDWQKWNDQEKAKMFFEKSIKEKYAYTPSHYELAKLNFDNGMYQMAIDTCSMILNKLKPDNNTRYDAVKLSESVIYIYIDEINLFIENRDFTPAIQKLKLCETYSENIPGVKYFEEFDEIHGKLYKAYYMDLVEETKVKIDQMNLEQAQFNIDSLERFRKGHTQYILNAQNEHELLNLLYNAWMEAGISYQSNQVPDSSLYAFTQANIICHKYEIIYCTQELIEQIAQARVGQYNYMIMQAGNLIDEQLADSALNMLHDAETFRANNNLNKNQFVSTLLVKANQLKYIDLIRTGEQAFESKRIREALAFYDEAKDLEKEYNLEADSILRFKIVQAAESYIIFLCIQGETLVEALHVNEANQKLNSANNLYEYYKLHKSEQSTQAIQKLSEKLKEGECNQASYYFNIQIIAAQKFIEQHEFIYAWQALEKARRISSNNQGCALADSINVRLISQVKPMYHYQQAVKKIEALADNNKFEQVVEQYSELTNFYNDSVKYSYGTTHKDIFSYITTHQITGVLNYGVKYYTNMGMIDTALLVLNKLRDREYNSSWSKECQSVLGTQLALNDIETNESIDPKIKVIDYTKADKWYKPLKKAYLAGWKNR